MSCRRQPPLPFLLLALLALPLLPAGCGLDEPENAEGEDEDPVTWRVPQDVETIQGGIWSTAAGDTVLVAAGTYQECDILLAPGIWVIGETGDPDDVVIDAERRGVVLHAIDLDEMTTLIGLTLTGGRGDEGGGVEIDSSRVSLVDCVITGNEALVIGGGVRCRRESSVTLVDCEVSANSTTGYRGGGLWCGEESDVALLGCTVRDNTALIGAGIWCGGGASLGLSDTAVNGNRAGIRGGGLCLEGYGSLVASYVVCRLNAAPEGADGALDPEGDFTTLLSCCDLDSSLWLGWDALTVDDTGCP